MNIEPVETPEQALSSKERTEQIKLALSVLRINEAKVVRKRHFEGKLFREIAVDLGLSQGRVQQIHKKALKKLRYHGSFLKPYWECGL